MSNTREKIKKFNQRSEFFFAEGCFIIELDNSPDDPGLSIARARVEPGVTTRLHRLHGGVTERYVILEGAGRVEIGSAPPQEVGPGDVVIIPPLCAQRITNTGSGDLIFLAICAPRFSPDLYEDIEDKKATGRHESCPRSVADNK